MKTVKIFQMIYIGHSSNKIELILKFEIDMTVKNFELK